MKNAELIRALATDLTPLPPGKTRHEMLISLGIGSAASLLLLLAVYGVQPDLDTIAHGGPFLMKAWYGLSLAAIAGSMLMPMLRPAAPIPDRRAFFGVIIVMLAVLAVWQTAATNSGVAPLWLGSSWQRCALRIAALSVPVFIGVQWAIRRQAPLRLRATGALAGILSGGVAATVYALACNETGAGFVLVWYTIGIALCAAIGAVTGPFLLRWS